MICVDQPDFSKGNRKNWCHMMSDLSHRSDALQELHEFAKSMGLPCHWFQPRSSPHYDLSPAYRRKAIAAGATEVSNKDLVRRCVLIHRQSEEKQS